ncbi:hypothetical protein A5672_15635 [Mycobacterium alsense]|uniref:ATPase n=1 Tax=Mycobacterium alsense TaxID=324058 RepID=A0A1A2HCX1_9MYCO|nr:hypothetical protein [Mycobacterium alsense]MCV7380833.1 hypothetical protein [Mycobacterium alsense]OBG39000.1 hypothetical protein A5672_15635 [Mycobacterium alsense]OBI94404.1 hypothetical protein A5660_12230 [Mycobacterium alsense]OQZ91849.1 hypothetical protein BST11_06610 [Mycobacterium alsense]
MSSTDRTADVGRRDYAAVPPAVASALTEPFAVGRTRQPRTRRTVDLTHAQHRALDIWQREAADRLGVARVTGQDVLATLVDQLLNDPKLSAQVIRSLQARR